ncbi:2',5'-phosphodiesterase 12-like isoform X2 [Colletes gigas]|uniref:2',5'-phosphodiesterase 12-like isoform X2 n=1 Tax=Colletes gigas TaxID=935657 RepID=UPI001C9ABB02|nr:2',5'-phosphodiesterase 12-like isoform X2 [Colletes gigas]
MSVLVSKFHSKCLTSFLSYLKLSQHLPKYYSQQKLVINMNEAIIKYDEGSDNFQVSLRYVNPNLHVDRQFNFNRNVNESINTFLQRMNVNITNYAMKNLKRKMKKMSKMSKDTESTNSTVDDFIKDKTIKLVKNDFVMDGELTCKSILEDPLNIKLVIFDTECILKQNVPCVTKIKLPSSILTGFPTYPTKFESTYVDKLKSTFNWYKRNKGNWILVGEDYLYTPNVSDIGCQLKLMCIPRNNTQTGPTIEVTSDYVVEAGPGPCPFEVRHGFTKNKLSGKSFRVTSYNILASIYSDTELSKDVLYPYCPSYALSMDYRKLLILKELIGYNADIICLQEVDKNVYENDLVALCALNYDGIYNLKDFSGFNTIWSQIQNENVKQTFLNRSTIIQTLTLRSKENSEILLVGNTHLYYRPQAGYIRLLQAYYGLIYLQKFAKEMIEQNPECNVSIIYCGDFNSGPESGVYRLMTEKYIPENHAEWKFSPDESVDNVSLKHDLNLSSACGTPEYTNYTGAFSGCLDYIFYQKDYLGIEQIVPLPSKDELSLHTALPSVVFPSDHIALCADLKWLK